MNLQFIKSVNKKLTAIQKDLDASFKYELASRWEFNLLNIDDTQLTNYQSAFLLLLIDKLVKIYEKIEPMFNISIDDYYYGPPDDFTRQHRGINLPKDNKSNWQLLYETTGVNTNNSGPIFHFYFDGWSIEDFEVYMYGYGPSRLSEMDTDEDEID